MKSLVEMVALNREKTIPAGRKRFANQTINPTGITAMQNGKASGRRVIFTMARTLRAEPSALLIAIRFCPGAIAPGHQAAAAGSRPREQARVYVSR